MMKDKLILRRLALLLCLSLIVGIMPITALSVPVALNVPAPATELVVNGDFQTDLSSWGGTHTSAGDKVEVVDGVAQFTATSKALYLIQTIDVPDAVNEVFKLKVDFTRISGTGKPYIMLKFKNAANAATSLTYKNEVLDATGEYVIELTAPAGTVVAHVEVGNNSGANAIYTIDNISLTKVVQEPDPTDSTEGTESTEPTVIFTDFLDGSAIPDISAEQWKESNGGEETVLTKESGNYKVGRGGNNKLVFQAPAHNVQYYAKSPVLPVTGGKTYTVDYQAARYFDNNVSAAAELTFVDAQGNVLDTESADAFDSTAADGVWTDMSVSADAPVAAVGVYIKFTYCVPEGGNNNYWVRNLTVTESGTAADPNAGNLLVNGDLESGTTGWVNAQVSENTGRTGNALLMDSNVKGKDVETAADSRAAVTAGQSYTFSFYAKRDAADASNKGLTAYVLWYDANSTYMTGKASYWTVNPTTDWIPCEYTVTAPEGAAAAAVRFYGDSSFNGVIYIDDAVFAEVVSTEPDPTESTAASDPSESTGAAQPGELVNGDFENGTTGWMNAQMSENTGRTGNALLMDSNVKGKDVETAADSRVSVTAGKSYQFSFYAKRDAADASNKGLTAYVLWYDANGTYMTGKASYWTVNPTTDWTPCEYTVTAPEGAAAAAVRFYGASDFNGIIYIDDVAFAVIIPGQPDPTESTAASDPSEQTDPSVSTDPSESTGATESGYVFQDFMDGSAIPDVSVELWKEFNGDEETVLTKESGTYKVGRGGNNKLVFQSPSKGVQYYARSPVFAVTGGMTYTVDFQSCWYFSTNSDSSVELVFVDAQGNVIASENGNAYNKNATESVWADMSLSAVAPEAATGAYLKFNFLTDANTNYWVRNLTVSESETIVIPTEPRDPNLMLEDKFEIFVDADDANSGPLGWYSSDDSGSVYSIAIACEQRNSIKQDGYYLLLQMVGNWTIQSADFDVKPGYEYTADFLARKLVDNENFNGYLTICFVDMFGLPLKADKVTVGKTYGQWAAENVKAIAPAGAVKAYLVFGLDNDNRSIKADYAIDNLKVTQSTTPAIVLEAVPEIPTRPVFEDSFDNAFTPEGESSSVRIPVGWTASQESAAMACSKYDDYNGTNNLCLQNTDDKWIRSPLIDAVAGYTYTAIFMEKKLNPAVAATGGYVKIVFTDADGNILDEVTKAIGAASKWTLNGVQALAPAGAAKLYVEFGIAKHTGGTPTFCVEDLQVIEAEGALSTVGGFDNNPATADDFAPVFVSALMVMTVACAVVLLKKRRSF